MDIEQWVKNEYRDGVSPLAAARQLCRYLESGSPLKRLLEDILAEANREAHETAMQRDAFREVLADIPKN